MPQWINSILPILILLTVVVIVIKRLPKIELGHSKKFLSRRVLNWVPLGLTYAMLYMGRYNLTVSKGKFEEMKNLDGSSLMGNEAFGIIFGVGTIVYGFSFLINGPLTDRFGGRFSILMGAAGSMTMNLIMGLATLSIINQGPFHSYITSHFVVIFSALYAINMYFQSFGAVAIVKVNASWFHVRERGVFGAIFGILISLGIYFAFDIGRMILNSFGIEWVFLIPATMLTIFWIIDVFVVRNSPQEAGLKDFDTADASSGDDGPRLGTITIFKKMFSNPIIMTIAIIEFSSGFLRQSIMQWFRTFAKQTDSLLHLKGSFVYDNWGLLLCVAGIMGGVLAGIISDHVFGSRRGPVAVLLYAVMFTGALTLIFVYKTPAVGILILVMSMAVIGVHGMLSGTASMDFGGRKNVGMAVGIIDGFVYLGTAVMSFTYAILLPKEQIITVKLTQPILDVINLSSWPIRILPIEPIEISKLTGPATDPNNWLAWPIAMVPIAALGLILSLRVWNAYPKPKTK